MLIKSLLLLCCCLSIQDQAIKKDAVDEFAVKWTANFVTNDAKKMMSFYEKSDKLEIRMSSGAKIMGFDKLNEFYASEFKSVRFFHSEPKKISGRNFGSSAVVSFEHVFRFKVPDESIMEGHIQTVLVLRKIEGKWKIINEHSSPIENVPRIKSVKE